MKPANAYGADPTSGVAQACPVYPANIESLLGVLRYQLEHLRDRTVCHRVIRQRKGLASEPLTVAALVERALRAAAVLQAAGVRDGDRVILSLSDVHDFLVAFVGALIAGAAAVPLPTVAESGAPRSFAARVRAVCTDCAPVVAVVEGAERFARVAGSVRPGMVVLEPRDLGNPQIDVAIALQDRAGAVPAFIQYTSGSTGTPKGVVVTHANLLANCKAIREATRYSRADRMVSWLPLHHDMGLVGGLLTSIYCAAETFIMPPLTFLARPVTWLEAITEYAASLTIGPTFAYSLCARKIPAKQLDGIDLSSVRLAYIGAEPIDPATVVAFVERFEPYGLSADAMYPVYGLAEATLAVAFPIPGSRVRYDTVDRRRLAEQGVAVATPAGSPDGVTFVSVGQPLPDHRIAIIDRDSGTSRAERQVGELLVEGGSVTPRYFADGPGSERTRLHTGDLAYFADGHLYIVDRIKDLVIIGGQNYAPSDIENAVADMAGLRRGRIVAFSSPGASGTEDLHIVAEASPESWRHPQDLADEVRHRLRQDVGLSAASVTIVAPGSLERTSSGKIQRRACAEAHRHGRLSVVQSQSEVWAYQLGRRRAVLLYRARHAARRALDWISMRRARSIAESRR